jgi:nucleotide-binding universal stress UspA family protein
MAKPILVGYDPSAGDRAPVEFGVAAAAFTGAPLIIGAVHASPAALGTAGEGLVEEQLAREPSGALEQLEGELGGVGAEVRALPGTSAPRALHNAAEEYGAGLLVIGSTHRGRAGRLLPGSTAERLMHGAPCPLAVVPCEWQPGGGVKTIGVAFVDTPEGRDALDGAVALARRAGAKLRVLSAGKPHGLDYSDTYGGGSAETEAVRYEDIGSAIRVAVEKAVKHATEGVVGIEIEPDVSVGDPADFLIAASENVDLLVCGSRGYGPRRAVLLGGVSRRVTAEAHCPVIVLARGAEAGLDALIEEQAGAIG